MRDDLKPAIGIFGDGQLAQMTCLAGRALGYEMHVYASDAGNPGALTADRVWLGSFDDESLVREFASAVDAVTYDTELLPIESVRLAARYASTRPGPDVLWIAQNRIREREFLRSVGVPMPRVAPVRTREELSAAIAGVGTPAVLKTAEQGYDGKGQVRIMHPADAQDAWSALDFAPCVLEEWIELRSECSVIVAGAADGGLVSYPVVDNVHVNHILHQSSFPSALPEEKQRTAVAVAERIARELGLVGLLAVEMFHTQDGRILVNELAPRPHNSGHHTQLSAATSQFAQLCRAVAGAPLGDVTTRPAVMINLLGDLFVDRDETVYRRVGFLPEPDDHSAVYFYGKQEARPGRKMGHVLAVGETRDQALRRAAVLYARYAGPAGATGNQQEKAGFARGH